MGTKSPCGAEHGEPVLLCSQRQPDPATLAAVSWTVLMAQLIVVLPAMTGMGESPILQNKRQSSPMQCSHSEIITFFSSSVNPYYENGWYETVGFEMGRVPQLGVSSGRAFNLQEILRISHKLQESPEPVCK